MTDLEDFLFLHTTEVEEVQDAIGNKTLLTLECKYFETLEHLRSGNIKEIKFWMYKEEAIRLASLIASVAHPDADQDRQ